MKIRFQALVFALIAPLLATGCSQVRAKSAFKDGNKAYKEEKFKQAIENYERALEFDPTMSEAMFYLGSSHQNMYRPGKDSPENTAHLDEAVKQYKACVAADTGVTDQLKKVKRPFQILGGGYQIVFKNGKWSQVFGSLTKEKRFAREDRRGHRSEIRKRRARKKAEPATIARLQRRTR